MPFLYAGARCPLCGAPMRAGERLFSTWGVFFERSDPLWRYCDAVVHWACYAEWPDRPRFARAYFDMWARARNHLWGTVWADDDVLLTVNPDPVVASLWLVLAATGTRRDIKLRDWPRFLVEGPALFPHEVERLALEAVMPRLRGLGAEPDALVARAVFPPPPSPDPAQIAREAERKKLHAWNRAARRAAVVAASDGVTCPACGAHHRDHRFVDGASGRRPSFFVCAVCARSFSHEDVAATARSGGGD